MGTAPIGGTKGENEKQNRSVFDKNTFFETATKKNSHIFSGPNGFVGWVPNRQNRSPTDEFPPQPTQFGPPTEFFLSTDNLLGAPPTQLPTPRGLGAPSAVGTFQVPPRRGAYGAEAHGCLPPPEEERPKAAYNHHHGRVSLSVQRPAI